MKKWIFAGLTLILAFAITMLACDDGIAPNVGSGDKDDIKSYSLTLNITGDKEVPTIISPNKSGRALTNALAQINHDYYEVVFYYDDTAGATHDNTYIARTSWARGEGAALSVFRGSTAAGIDYGSVDYSLSAETTTTAPDTGAAILLVGKKESGRFVLLAVGKLVGSENNDGSPVATPTVITSKTSKVTFDIVTLASAIHPDKANLDTKSSFYTTPDNTNGSFVFPGTIDEATTAGNPGGGTNFVEQPFNNVNFPLFMLASNQGKKCSGTAGACTLTCCGYVVLVPASDCSACTDPQPGNPSGCVTTDSTPCPKACCGATGTGPITSCTSCNLPTVPPATRYYAAKFTFTTATATPGATVPTGHTIGDYVKGIVAATPASHQYVDDKVPPAVIINGEKMPAITTENLGVVVEMKNNNVAGTDTGNSINPVSYFIITVPGDTGGMIAFNFNIPVYGIINQISNNGIQPILWLIQPGLERFYVDNGIGLGGSVLLGIGDPTKVNVGTGFVQ